ncbi:hypothetical protein PtB15_5B779 [Puccinia triticina]|nr:hypothetical protein PtB15_5B779 [Puccinia triticina]
MSSPDRAPDTKQCFGAGPTAAPPPSKPTPPRLDLCRWVTVGGWGALDQHAQDGKLTCGPSLGMGPNTGLGRAGACGAGFSVGR